MVKLLKINYIKGGFYLRPIDYLNSEERFIYKSIREDIEKCKSRSQLKLLESKLDKLLERAILRYRREKGIK